MSAEPSEPIVCRSTPWYHKRRILMLLLVWGFCAFFIYDWQVRYPRNRDATLAWEKLKEEKGEKEADAAYAKLAPEHGWPAELDKSHPASHWDWQINVEQPSMAALTALIGTVMLYFYFRTSRGTLTADAQSFTTHWGRRVPFADAFRIDRRKWAHKGLAYVFYKDAAGKEQRAVIDDLIFDGAQKVLDRLQASFKGEVIDLAKTEPEKPETDAPDAGEPAAAEAGEAPEKTDPPGAA